MFERFKVQVYTEYGLLSAVNVMIYEEKLDGIYAASVNPKTGLLDFSKVEIGTHAVPTFKLTHSIFSELVTKANEMGVKPKEASKVEGLLEATKYHLEDMRKLIFGKD